MRLTVQAKPGSRHPRVVLVETPDGEIPMLLVHVTARAVDGAANRAIREAVASAFGIRPSKVEILRGDRSRIKHVEVDADPGLIVDAFSHLPRAQPTADPTAVAEPPANHKDSRHPGRF